MLFLRAFVAVLLSVLLAFFALPLTHATDLLLGILTVTDHAHLDEADAYEGLSVFEGEQISTDAEGRLGLRVGHATLALGAKREAVLLRLSDRMLVDMSAWKFTWPMQLYSQTVAG